MDFQQMLDEANRLNANNHARPGFGDKDVFYTVAPLDPEKRFEFQMKFSEAADPSLLPGIQYQPKGRNEKVDIFEVEVLYNELREVSQINMKKYFFKK